jgi:hypothetical protein
MKHPWFVFLLPMIALGQAQKSAPPAGSRFSPDATALLQAISVGCTVSGRTIAADPHPQPIVTRLCSSSEPAVRAAAEVARRIAWQKLQLVQDGRAMEQRHRQASEQTQRELGMALLGSLFADDEASLGDQLRDAGEAAKRITGGAAGQEEVNRYYRTIRDGMRMDAELKEKLRLLARASPIAPRPVPTVWIRFDPVAGQGGYVDVTNGSGRPLHHCLLITQATMDRARLEPAARTEQAFGDLLPGLMGVEPRHAEALKEVVQLRTEIQGADKGVPVYLDEIPAGAVVRLPFAEAGAVPLTTRVVVSLWCDEASAEGVEVRGLEGLKQSVAAKRAAPHAAPGQAPKKNSLGNWDNPLNHPARRVGR